MKILNDNESLLTNYEVYKLMEEKDADKPTEVVVPKVNTFSIAALTSVQEAIALDAFEKQVLYYLKGTAAAKENSKSINKCMKALESYKLTKAEKLEIVNFPPSVPVEVNLLVEECEERLTDEQVSSLIDNVQFCLFNKKPVD